MKSGIEYMTFSRLVSKKVQRNWFPNWWRNCRRFPICVVPMLYQDMEMHDIPFGVISAKFQIQQPVMVLLEQFLMKKLLG
jgi:hypothetical protein